jgi:hypothetical protein
VPQYGHSWSAHALRIPVSKEKTGIVVSPNECSLEKNP